MLCTARITTSPYFFVFFANRFFDVEGITMDFPHSKLSRPFSSETGSFMVAGAFFLIVFLLVSAVSVDLARYFMERNNAQEIAENAALAGAQALNQVRSLENINKSNILDMALKQLSNRKGYDQNVYEYVSTMDKGDIQFSTFPPDANHSDTYFRVGVQALNSFEPYFLPRSVFGDQFHIVKAKAVAEAVPTFSKNYYQISQGPGNPISPLAYGIYSEKNVKPETMDCFKVDGDIHANDGYVKIEEMTGDGCGTGESVRITGNVEAGNPGTGSGNVTFENITGTVESNVLHAGSYTHLNGPTIQGNVKNEDPADETLTVPPTPDSAPGDYNDPICTFNARGGEKPISDFSLDTGSCSSGGTVYVKNGSLKISGANMNGNYTLVADQHVKFEDTPDLKSDDMFVYSVNSYVKFENVSNAEINASIYAPNGEVKWETSSNVQVNGGLVSGTMAKLETSDTLAINYKPHASLLPSPLQQPAPTKNIPDHYRITLID